MYISNLSQNVFTEWFIFNLKRLEVVDIVSDCINAAAKLACAYLAH